MPDNLEKAVFAEPLAILIVQQMVHSEATSALPNAPIRDDRSRIGIAAKQTRLRLATSLRAVASRVDPYVAPRASQPA